MAKTKRKAKKETSFFVRLALFALAVLAAVLIAKLQLQFNEYKITKQQLQAEVDELQDKVDEIKNRADRDMDKDYVVEVAKEKLNMRLPEEIIFYNDLFN